MADNGSNTGIVALVAIFVLVVLVGFFGARSGMFTEGGSKKDVDIKVEVPTKSANPAPAAAPKAP
jgi:hypothetical protein